MKQLKITKHKCKQCWLKVGDLNLVTVWITKYCSIKCRDKHIRTKLKEKKEKDKIRKAKVREKKAESVGVLTKKFDTIFSRFIRLRDSIATTGIKTRCRCITCSNIYDTAAIHNWHFASRRFYITRWEEKNCNAQCYMCNVWLSWEQYKHWIEIDKKYWEWTAEELIRKWSEVYKLSSVWLKEQIAIYEEKYNTLIDLH